MIRILIVLILAAIVLPIAYFSFNSVSLAKKMLVAGGAIGAAAMAVFLQFLNFPFYIPLLAIVGVSLIASFIYAKLIEKEELEKMRRIEERKVRKEKRVSAQAEEIEKSAAEPVLVKSFAMQSISTGGEGQ